MEYLDIVNELNNELYEKFGETEYDFNYSTNGYVNIISFGNLQLWSSEMDDRKWIEEKNNYEPLKPFIKLLFNKEIEKLARLKL